MRRSRWLRGRRIFLLRLVLSPSALAGLRAALALQGNGLQPIPAARGLAPLTAAEQVAPDRPSRLRRCALRLRGVCAICGRCHNRRLPSLITSSATVARARVPSRRAGPCPRCAAGRTNPSLVSLTAPVRALLTVAGDELRKDGGNEAGPGLRADPTGKPQKRAPNLGIRWGFQQQPCQE